MLHIFLICLLYVPSLQHSHISSQLNNNIYYIASSKVLILLSFIQILFITPSVTKSTLSLYIYSLPLTLHFLILIIGTKKFHILLIQFLTTITNFLLQKMGFDHHVICISLFFLVISSWILQGLVTEGKSLFFFLLLLSVINQEEFKLNS